MTLVGSRLFAALLAGVMLAAPAVHTSGLAGMGTPRLRDVHALAGIGRRDYAYDRFWMVFPLKNGDGLPLFGPQATEAELIVRIYDKEARVKWPIPASIRSAAD